MKAKIRELIEKNERKHMPEPAATSISPEELQEILTAAIAAAKAPSPLEEKKYKEEMEREQRRNLMSAELAKIEEENLRRKRESCSHTKDAQSGQSVAKGSYGGVWCTSGQVHANGNITIICQRCSNTWTFKASPQELEYANNAEHGLLGFAPPPDSRVIAA